MTPREAMKKLLALGLQVSAMRVAYAWPPIFGGEMTFTKPELYTRENLNRTATPQNEAARDALADLVKRRCEGCTVVEGVSPAGFKNFKVTYPDGWYFVIAIDPAVVEVQTKPATVVELEREEARLQKDLFDNAASLGLKPDFQLGAGSIHMGFESAFAEHPGLFHNYFVDLANHPEVSIGSFGIDVLNGPPLALLEDAQRAAFKEVLRRYDQGLIANDRAFAQEIQRKVYTRSAYKSSGLIGKKYQAYNLTRIVKKNISDHERTFENRTIRPQQNAHEFVLHCKLQQARLEYLMKRKMRVGYVDRPLPVYHPNSLDYIGVARKYVTESNLDWKEYEKLLMDKEEAEDMFYSYRIDSRSDRCSGPLRRFLRISK